MTAFKIYLIALIFTFVNAQTPFRLANYYQDEMVLQMGPKRAVIWGYGTVGASVDIAYDDQQINVVVEADGKWLATLIPHGAGGPVNFQITHNAETTITLSAYFGDVWVCSGQSNMAMAVNAVYNSTEETAKALTYYNIRLLKVQREFNLDTELDEVTSFSTPWSAPTESNVGSFSALCLFYGERMADTYNKARPIGLIDSTWGGTRIEAWMSQRVRNICNTPPNDGTEQNSESALWNAMMHPLSKSTVRGAIWYQGEANVGKNPNYYSCHLSEMANDWKNTFPYGDVVSDTAAFPFGVVQLGPTTSTSNNYNWGNLRLHQTVDQGVLPNSGFADGFMATAYDLTDHHSPTGAIHPRDKQTVADRLANAAKSFLYGENRRLYGPVPVDAVQEAPGQITINYDSNIRIGGPDGFAFQKSDGTWGNATYTLASGTSVTVAVDADAVLLTLGFRASVCEYKECPVYSDDAESVPAQVWQWDITSLKKNY